MSSETAEGYDEGAEGAESFDDDRDLAFAGAAGVAEEKSGLPLPPAAESDEPAAGHPAPTVSTEALLAPAALNEYLDRWSDVQIGFVRDPHKAVAEADALVGEIADAFQKAVDDRRSRLAAVRHDEAAGTEDLRTALLGYRDFVRTLLPR
jgi:hypothetical protein